MPKAKPFVRPCLPNTDPKIRAAMLRSLGVSTPDDLYAAVPRELRLRGGEDP